jgi:hypothetical protein
MRARHGCVVAILIALGCSGPPPRVAPKKPPIADETACPRLCEDLVSCGGAPGRCVATCEEDRSVLRAGFEASFVTCVEHELVPPACSSSPEVAGDAKARSEKISLCYSATLEAYANLDGGKNFTHVLTSVCKRRVRCATVEGAEVEDGKQAACVQELTKQLQSTIAVKVLAAARDEVVANITRCVEERPCNESDPTLFCLLGGEKKAGEKAPPP